MFVLADLEHLYGNLTTLADLDVGGPIRCLGSEWGYHYHGRDNSCQFKIVSSLFACNKLAAFHSTCTGPVWIRRAACGDNNFGLPFRHPTAKRVVAQVSRHMES